MKSLSCVWLFATPWIVAHQAPLSMGFFQARGLEWVAICFSFPSSPDPGVKPGSPALHADALLSELPVHFSDSVMSNPLRPHKLQHARLPCPSPTPGAYSNSCPSHRWCHPTISSSVVPFSSHLQSFPASGSFPMSQFFISGGQSIGVSALASVLPVNIQDWIPLGLTGWISLQFKWLSNKSLL